MCRSTPRLIRGTKYFILGAVPVRSSEAARRDWLGGPSRTSFLPSHGGLAPRLCGERIRQPVPRLLRVFLADRGKAAAVVELACVPDELLTLRALVAGVRLGAGL